MNTIENYYEDSFLIEDLLEDDFLEYEEDLLEDDYFDDDLLDESFGEDFAERRRRSKRAARRINPRYPRGAKTKSNFGKGITPGNSQYVKKADLKKSLDAISKAVNSVKQSALVNGKALKGLDGKYNDFVKELARKDANQTKVLKNMQNMNMMGSLLNKPKFDEANLKIVLEKDASGKDVQVIKETNNDATVSFDQTLSLLLPMMTTMGDSKNGKSSGSDMMLPMVLLLSQNKDNNNSSNDNTLLLAVMMMMNK